MRKFATLLGASVAALLALSMLTPVARAAGPLRLTVGVPAPIGSIDLRDGTSNVAREIWRLQYPALTALTLDTLSPTPGLAESWVPTGDGTGWTYTIRAGATWSDGAPVSADDVVYSVERARAEDWPSAGTTLDALSATKIDDRTLTITSTSERGALPTLLAHVVPKHVFEAGTDVDDRGIVGGGDWRVVARTETEIRLEVVDRPGRPRLDEIVFRSYPDADALVAAIGRGDVDVAADLPPSAIGSLRAHKSVTVKHANDGDQWMLQARIDDPVARRAIGRAIDRDLMVEQVANGVGRATVLPIVARDASWGLDAEAEPALGSQLSYAPARARRALAGPSTRRLTLAAPDDLDAQTIAVFVTTALTDAGIDVATASASDADLVIVRRDPTDDPTPALAAYTCTGAVWCDPAYDAAFTAFTESTDFVTRRDAVRTMVRMLAEDAVEIDLFAPDELQAFRTDRVTGMLRAPEQERLVVFWPSVSHYAEIVPAQTKGGQEVPTSIFVGIAVAVVVVSIGALVVIARLRTSRPPVDRDVEGAVGSERLAAE